MADSTATIDYLSKDYEGFRGALLDFAASKMPEWQSRSEGDFGVTMVELMAYMGDVLSYYGDRIQAESYLDTASQRVSLLQIAQLLGYIPSNGVAATGTVTFETANPGKAVVVPAGTQVTTDFMESIDGSLIYETDDAVTVPENGGTATVGVTHGVTKTMVLLGVSDGLPGQQFRIPESPVLQGTVRLFVDSDTDGQGNPVAVEWSATDYLVDVDANDPAFTTFNDAYGATWVQLGDGINGVIPGIGLNVYATYRVGGGQIGNIAAQQITGFVSSNVNGVSISLDSAGAPVSSAMTGGADPESNEQIRANAPRVFRAQDRAVTLQDFKDVALGVPGVLRANAVAGTYTSVTLYVCGPNGMAPNDDLITAVSTAVQAKALAGTSVTVAAPTFVAVNVGATGNAVAVQVYDRYKQSKVAMDVQAAIQNLLSFANVDFGVRLTVSDFYAAIMSVPGVQYVSIPMVARADASQSGTADMVFREWEIPTAGSITIIANGGLV